MNDNLSLSHLDVVVTAVKHSKRQQMKFTATMVQYLQLPGRFRHDDGHDQEYLAL